MLSASRSQSHWRGSAEQWSLLSSSYTESAARPVGRRPGGAGAGLSGSRGGRGGTPGGGCGIGACALLVVVALLTAAPNNFLKWPTSHHALRLLRHWK